MQTQIMRITICKIFFTIQSFSMFMFMFKVVSMFASYLILQFMQSDFGQPIA